MMNCPINAAKFTIPPLPAGHVTRKRLNRLLDSWSDKRLIQVTAGAGFGKTSLLSAWAQMGARPVMWFSCDRDDREPSIFYAHLLRLVEPHGSSPTQDPLPGPEIRRQALVSLLSRLRTMPKGAVLFLDDSHLLAGSEPATVFLPELLPYIPVGTTLVLAAREDLGLPTMKMAAIGTLAELRAKDLVYLQDEIAQLLENRFPGCHPDPDFCARLARKTEGWAAGIQILLQASRSSDIENLQDALARMSGPGSNWFRYFAEEVIASLPPDLADFLDQTAVLPYLDGPLCDAFLRRCDSLAVLEDLSRRNLFTFALNQSATTFRYHHLFREFLLQRLQHNLRPARIRDLWLRSARILQSRKAWSEAAAAYAASDHPDKVLALMERSGIQLMAEGHYEVLRQALESLPARKIAASAAALVVAGRLADVAGDWPQARLMYRKAMRRPCSVTLRVEIVSLLAQLELRSGRFQQCRSLCSKVIEGPNRLPGQVRGRLLAMLGVAACELGKLDESELYQSQSLALYRRSRHNPISERTYYLLPANIHFRRGDFAQAKAAARQALVHFREEEDSLNICHCLGVLALVAAEAGQSHEGHAIADDCLRLAEGLNYKVMVGYGALALGKCYFLDGNLDDARERVDQARQIGIRLLETGLRSFTLITMAEIEAKAENRTRARRLAVESKQLARELKNPYLEVRSSLVFARLEAAHRHFEALKHWRQAAKTATKVGMAFEYHRLLLDWLTLGEAPPNKTGTMLSSLLSGARQLNHDDLFLTLAPRQGAQVLALALKNDIETAYTTRLLLTLGEAAVESLVPLVAVGEESSRKRVLDLLTQIGGPAAAEALAIVTGSGHATMVSPVEHPLDINALGPLEIRLAGTTLTLDDWKSARALRLLELLLTHHFRWVTKDKVMESLWPEADPRKAANNLRQSVHLLRRTLEIKGVAEPKPQYVQYHNDSLKLDPGSGFRYDVASFEEILDRAETIRRKERTQAAIPLLKQALDLYRGPFLSERPYDEIVTIEREHLRHRFHSALVRLMDALAEGGHWDEIITWCHRGLGEDPFHENFHWHLVHAQFKLGHRKEALQDYQRYEELMMGELDMMPAARLKSLAEQISSLGV